MGIFIHMRVSKSVTKEEWSKVYEETLQLVKAFPLAEQQKVKCRRIETICLVSTVEREETYGWNDEKSRLGWFADGDYETMRTAERYSLYREFLSEEEIEADAGDALMGVLPAYLNYDWDDPRCGHTYDVWGNKTQGEPYHMYLLSIACLIEARLGEKAFVYGDITRGQCVKAVELANKYLQTPIGLPDRCDMERFYRRVLKLPLSEKERLNVFEELYLGMKDNEFGKFIRSKYSEEICDEYWKDIFEDCIIGTVGFDNRINEYLLWGFDLGKLCRLVNYNDKDNVPQYEKFVKRIMDAKLYLENKNCKDILKIDQEESAPYSIYTLMAQFAFAGAGNRKVERYIPIDEIRKVLCNELGDKCDVEFIIESYLEKEEQDASEIFAEMMDKERQGIVDKREKYDITTYEELQYYETGDSIEPRLLDAVKQSFIIYESVPEEDFYTELMGMSARIRCRWLVRENRTILIRDKDWDKILTDIEENEQSFARYYPMVRLKFEHINLIYMAIAMVLNDEFYEYCKELVSED